MCDCEIIDEKKRTAIVMMWCVEKAWEAHFLISYTDYCHLSLNLNTSHSPPHRDREVERERDQQRDRQIQNKLHKFSEKDRTGIILRWASTVSCMWYVAGLRRLLMAIEELLKGQIVTQSWNSEEIFSSFSLCLSLLIHVRIWLICFILKLIWIDLNLLIYNLLCQ